MWCWCYLMLSVDPLPSEPAQADIPLLVLQKYTQVPAVPGTGYPRHPSP